ncbi:Dam family site-specific DNA-(adenine-N6)-methyltransferase [Lysinibacillus sp. UGB7]|uniref:Dam family site-specific DNA-(adenine-N6)-methyltransferase n=1 Tax=Lysinibacillus sp. UGB7 TaxID=3411039 RepID=UPI003B7D0009
MAIPHPIPYQGSKRNLAKYILECIPNNVERIVEPFAGSAAISIACADQKIGNHYWLNDINEPLAKLLSKMASNPNEVIQRYEYIWNGQLEGDSKEHYNFIRSEFNNTHEPEMLLYLLARCVKNAVRYNEKGEFNQGPDNRRKGKNPIKMANDIQGYGELLQNKITVTSLDYVEVLKDTQTSDLIYMDPPYQGTKGSSKRYIQGLDFEKFIEALEDLNKRNIPYIISFDGSTGNKIYGSSLPDYLNLRRINLNAGTSSQSTLTGNPEQTIEALYISKDVKISENKLKKIQYSSSPKQLSLEID